MMDFQSSANVIRTAKRSYIDQTILTDNVQMGVVRNPGKSGSDVNF
jgi:hypothetical protein